MDLSKVILLRNSLKKFLHIRTIGLHCHKMKLPTIQIDKPDNEVAGQFIRDQREKHGITLRRLAHEMGITPPFLSDMELGRRGWSPQRFELAQEKIKELSK